MTDPGVSAAPALLRRAAGWPVVVAANLVGGLAAVYPAALASWWLTEVAGGTPGYTSDPGFARLLGQVSCVLLVVGFVGGNAWLQWAFTGRRWAWWPLALACAALPTTVTVVHHALTYGPS